jgi:hypothetical protein
VFLDFAIYFSLYSCGVLFSEYPLNHMEVILYCRMIKVQFQVIQMRFNDLKEQFHIIQMSSNEHYETSQLIKEQIWQQRDLTEGTILITGKAVRAVASKGNGSQDKRASVKA